MASNCEDKRTAALEKLPFVFGGDFHSTARLNFQHFIQRRQYGYLLHPAIPIDSENLRVADVGAGTCIWLMELADELPFSTKLDAFDTAPEQYPPRAWLPRNISLYVQDAFKSFPTEFHGSYDIVHIALFILVVPDNDPSVLISNLLKLLKPGGYLQWNEVDTSSRRIIRTEGSSMVTSAIDDLEAYLKRRRSGTPPDWPAKLNAAFTEHGFTNVTLDRYPVLPTYRTLNNQNVLLMWEEMSRRMDEEDPSNRSGSGADLRKLLDRVAEEFHQGASMVTDLVVAVGQSRETVLKG